MHFWIDKRSQGCGFNGRYRIPPSISGYGRNQRNLSSGFYSESMVTPVRRFQSIESVANNGLRYARSSNHSRSHAGYSPATVHYNVSNSIRLPQSDRPPEMLRISGSSRSERADKKLMCISQVSIAGIFIIIFVMCSFYVYKGVGISLPSNNVFMLLVLVVIIVMVIVVLYITITHIMIHKTSATSMVQEAPTVVIEQHSDSDERQTHAAGSPILQNPEEMPPPPYHIAVRLAPQPNSESSPIIRDSPPPTYEKAVT